MQQNDLGLAVSFGGTKTAVALVDPVTADIVAKTDPIPWRADPQWQSDDPLFSLMRLVAEHSQRLSDESGLPLSEVSRIGIAWPGPGRYSAGMLTATFIPDCSIPQDIHALVRAAMGAVCRSARVDSICIRSYLDVVARARGITRRLPEFVTSSIPAGNVVNGIVLNIATGMAGAIIHDGDAMLTHPALGESYGQWGRYLFWRPAEDVWSWRPTEDGSIREDAGGIRFTDLCGGPAIARRFLDRWLSQATEPSVSPALAKLLRQYPTSQTRDVHAEKRLLRLLTHDANGDIEFVCSFVEEVGRQIGRSLACLKEGLGDEYFGDSVILTGGIGECFAAPSPDTTPQTDRLIQAVYEAAGIANMTIARTTNGLDAELVGCVIG